MNPVAALPTYVREKMTQVILPIEYGAACRAIAACRSIDESKQWGDRVDALAAWAKIYKNNEVAAEAKRLKLHAYRRMSELAEELQPCRTKPGGGYLPGPYSLLKSHGFSHLQVQHIRRIGAIPQGRFDDMVNSARPPGIVVASTAGIGHAKHGHTPTVSPSWRLLSSGIQSSGGPNLRRFLSLFCRRHSAKELARGIEPEEVRAVRAMIRETQEWLDELEQYLPQGGGESGGFDLESLLQQAQQMQSQLESAQERLAEARIEGTVGGGAVTVTVNGIGELQAVTIKAGGFDGSSDDDLSDLGDLIVAAYRDAKSQADALATNALGPLAGGGMPGLGGPGPDAGPGALGFSQAD